MAKPFEDLLSVKATGKAPLEQQGPEQSGILAQMAKQQSQNQLLNIEQQGQVVRQQQEAQREAIKEEGDIQRRALSFQEAEQSFSNMEQVKEILQKSEFSELELESRQDGLRLEAAAHKLMMEDQSYVHQLREIGRRRRLTDKLKFDEELDRVVYGEEMSMLMDELGWKESQGTLARQRSEELFNIDIDTALAIAAADMKAENVRAIAGGLTGAATVAAEEGVFDRSKTAPVTLEQSPEGSDFSGATTDGQFSFDTLA